MDGHSVDGWKKERRTLATWSVSVNVDRGCSKDEKAANLHVLRAGDALILNFTQYVDEINRRSRQLIERVPMQRFSWRIRLRTLLIAVALLAFMIY